MSAPTKSRDLTPPADAAAHPAVAVPAAAYAPLYTAPGTVQRVRFAHRATLTAALTTWLTLAMCLPAWARPPDAATTAAPSHSPTISHANGAHRFDTQFTLSQPGKPSQRRAAARLRLFLAPDSTPSDEAQPDRDWQIVIQAADKRTVLRETFPAWAAQPYYEFALQHAPQGATRHVVLLTARPDPTQNPPPDSAQFQVAWVVSAGKWQRIDTARFSVLDGGTRWELVTRDGVSQLIQFRPGADAIFCGASHVAGEAPVVAEVYDPQRASFALNVDVDALLKGAGHLSSELADDTFNPPFLQAWSQWFAASSERRGLRERGSNIRPLELGDRKFDTAWMEGVTGLGRGEFVSAQINDAVGLSSVRIVAGIAGTQAQFKAFARPTKVLLSLSDGSRFIVALKPTDFAHVESGRGVMVTLPGPIKTTCLSVMLLEATAGVAQKGQPVWAPETVAIAQITPYSSLHFGSAEQTAERIVQWVANEPDARTRQRIAQMALSLRTPLTDEVRRAVTMASPVERKRIISLIGSLPATEAAPLLLGFLRQIEPDSPEYRTIKRSLASLQAHAAPGLLAYLDAGEIDSPQKYVDILRLLGRVATPDQLMRLIEHLGEGDAAIRNERIRAILAGKEAMVDPLLHHAHLHTIDPGGQDALRALALLGRRLNPQRPGALKHPMPLEDMLDQPQPRRTLLRLLAVARYFEVADFANDCGARLARHDDPLVRGAVFDALAHYPGTAARDLLIAGLGDASPDARLAAINALAERSDLLAVAGALADFAHKEQWPAASSRAYGILAGLDAPAADAAFTSIFHDEPDSPAAQRAARELERAQRSIDPEVAIALIEDHARPAELRLQMIDLLGVDSSPRGAAFLLDMLQTQGWLQQFADPRDQRHARQRVFMALGRRRDPTARTRLLEIARQSDQPDVQQISLRALAFYKDPQLLRSLRDWRRSADPQLRALIDPTITMIERRQALDAVQAGVRELAEEIAPTDDE